MSTNRDRGFRTSGAQSLTSALLAIALVLGGLGLAQSWPRFGAAVMAAAAVAAAVFLNQNQGLCRFAVTPGLVIGASYVTFMWAGLAGITDAGGLAYVSAGTIDWARVVSTVGTGSVVVSGGLLMAGLVAGRCRIGVTLSEYTHQAWTATLAHTLTAVALASLVLFKSSGSLAGISDSLVTHDKQLTNAVNASSGGTIWALFSLPAVLAAGLAALSGRSRPSRAVAWGEFAALQFVGLTFFGSRLLLTLGLVGLAGAWFSLHRRNFPIRYAIAAIVGLVVISGPVLAARGVNDTAEKSLSSVVGYNILATSDALQSGHSDVGQELRDPRRNLDVLQSVLPNIGPFSRSASKIQQETGDVLVAESLVGTTAAESTGFPPSLPTSLQLMFGLWGAFLVFSVIASLVTVLSRILLDLRSSTGSLGFALLMCYTFDAFKGGDVALDLVGYLKRAVAGGIVLVVVRAVALRRGAS